MIVDLVGTEYSGKGNLAIDSEKILRKAFPLFHLFSHRHVKNPASSRTMDGDPLAPVALE